MVKEFAFINFFRAIAAFWVLSAHCMIWGGWYGIPVPSAKIAVDLFMMISGYLMAANAFNRRHFEPLTTSKNWLRFWLRRFFRLAPAYYLSLALAIVSSSYFLSGYQELQHLNPARWPAGGVYDPSRVEYTLQNIMLHLSFLFGLHPSYSFSTFLPDWSLSLEMQFYFVFPFLLFLMNKFGFLRIAIFAGFPIVIVGFLIHRYFHYSEPSLLFMKINYFIAGILLFRILGVGIGISRRKCYALVLCAIGLVSIDLRYGKQIIVLPVIFFSMLTLGWLEAKQRTPVLISLLVNNRFVKFASDSSYSVYLFHGFFISSFGLIISSQNGLSHLPPHHLVFIMFLFVATSAYLTAYMVYQFVELPGIRIGKHMIEKIAPRSKHTYSEHESEKTNATN